MRKFILSVLVFALVSIAPFATAENTLQYYIPELELSIDIPITIKCVFRDSDETNTLYQTDFFDYDKTHQYMLENNMYLYGMAIDPIGEFSIMVIDYEDQDFNTLDSISLSFLGNKLRAIYLAQGVSDAQYEIYQGKKDKAIRLNYLAKSEKKDQYVVFYFITHASRMLGIRFITFNSAITDTQDKMLKEILDSFVWEKKIYSSAPKGKTDVSIFIDNETGLSFLVPSGWNEVQFVATEENKKVKYRIDTDNVWVLYESEDMWEEYAQKYGDLFHTSNIKREDVNNNFLSKELVAAQLGCNESDISMVTIGNQEYYCMKNSNPISIGNISFDAQNIVYICIRNAYLYWFQLSGIDILKYQDSFNRFMRTVEYP